MDRETENGNMRIFTCKACSKIHVETGNVLLHFSTPEKLKAYLDYLESIDVSYYETINGKKGLKKVIILPVVGDSSVNLAFTVQEFEAVKEMIRDYLTCKTQNTFVMYTELPQSLSLN
jgi:hypothetical protein